MSRRKGQNPEVRVGERADGIFGGKVITLENPPYIKLTSTWIILNSGGGPTLDKPEILLAALGFSTE